MNKKQKPTGTTRARGVRLTPEEWEQVQKLADADGLSDRSAWIRRQIRLAAKRLERKG